MGKNPERQSGEATRTIDLRMHRDTSWLLYLDCGQPDVDHSGRKKEITQIQTPELLSREATQVVYLGIYVDLS
jgi:hypothetical protein